MTLKKGEDPNLEIVILAMIIQLNLQKNLELDHEYGNFISSKIDWSKPQKFIDKGQELKEVLFKLNS